MSTHNISLYKEVNKRYTDCHLKTTKFLDCALIGVCAVIRSNTVVYDAAYTSSRIRIFISSLLCVLCNLVDFYNISVYSLVKR